MGVQLSIAGCAPVPCGDLKTVSTRSPWISTRGGVPPMSFLDALMAGWAPDGGMFLPTQIPKVSLGLLSSWRGLSYPEVCVKVLSLFIGEEDIPASDLRAILARAFANFGHEDVVTMKPLPSQGPRSSIGSGTRPTSQPAAILRAVAGTQPG